MKKVKWLALGGAGCFLAEQRREARSLSREHEMGSPAPL